MLLNELIITIVVLFLLLLMLQLERGKAADLLAKLKGGYEAKDICKVCEK